MPNLPLSAPDAVTKAPARLRMKAGITALFVALACGGAAPLAAQAAPDGGADAAVTHPVADSSSPPLGLMGTIPIFWGEADGLGDLLNGTATSHWARAQLERQWRLVPLDHLDSAALQGIQHLLLAQPRAFTAAENVALDGWVRAGGKVLLFADPMLTGHSRFALGDRRRPQDVILLSPILTRWGLRLEFVEDQPDAPQLREIAGSGLPVPMRVPVRLAGRLVATGPGAGAGAQGGEVPGCAVEGGGLIAQCAIGAGKVFVVADAALLDLHDPAACAGPALDALARRAFAPEREIAGTSPASPADLAENCHFRPQTSAAEAGRDGALAPPK